MVAAIAVGAIVVPASAVAQITSISIGQAQLGPQGASLSVPVTVQCDFGWNLGSVNVNVVQKSAHFLAQGNGFADWFGAPCVGPGTRIVTVTDYGVIAFKPGKAAATANVFVSNPTTSGFFNKTVSQTIRIGNQPLTYVDPLG